MKKWAPFILPTGNAKLLASRYNIASVLVYDLPDGHDAWQNGGHVPHGQFGDGEDGQREH